MNIKISKEEHERLQKCPNKVIIEVGSHMYKSNTYKSDLDLLCIYEREDMFGKFTAPIRSLPNIHQFQYTDEEKHIDYLYCTSEQFWKNQRSGDSTINSDVVMFSNLVIQTPEVKLKYCRTYKVIKAYLGFAERDVKQYYKGVHKLRHALRGIYVAKMLIAGFLPLHSEMKSPVTLIPDNYNPDYWLPYLTNECGNIRRNLNEMYNNGEIPTYYIPEIGDTLLQKMLDANNIKEFKYD